jgi:WhiB family redox-sensing transcriptional regulator
MTAATAERAPWAIPEAARVEWQILAAALEDAGTVPCREGDPEAWWPDRKHLDAPSTRAAVQGCWRCPAREACGAYALAADEREGIWAGLLPDERRDVGQAA